MNKKLVLQGLGSAVGEIAYIAIVTGVMSNASQLFGQKQHDVIGPIVFLTLIVLSVAVSGALIFGRSVMLYLDGKKKESLEVFGYTIGWLMIILAIILAALNLMK